MDTTADCYMYAGVRMMAMGAGEVIGASGVIVQTAAIAFTAYYASRGLKAWRDQLLGKRRIELAEEALVATFKVESALNWIRSPAGYVGEGKTRKRGPGEPDEHTDMRDSYFAPIERIQQHEDDFAQFSKVRVLVQVHFGTEALKPFDAIFRAQRAVVIGARMLIRTSDQGRSQENTDRWEAAIWSQGEDDELSRRVRDAVQEIENLCRKHLKEEEE